MNIFVVSKNPSECAKSLDDKRVVKMVLETAQLLSNAQHRITGSGFYRKTHINHPCSIWVSESWENYRWTTMLFLYLCIEYSVRYSKKHKCFEKLHDIMNFHPRHFSRLELTPFANCTPYKEQETLSAYKTTLLEKWLNDKRTPKWTNRVRPNW